jgi:hypothetical protein
VSELTDGLSLLPRLEVLYMRNLRKVIVLACPLLLLATVPTLGWAKKGGTDRPFKGYANSTSTVVTPDNPAPDIFQPENPDNKVIIGYFDVTYVGQTTHMGKITRQEYAVLYEDFTFEGLMFFVAANGDELVADLDGGFTGPTTGAGCYTFIGGTGRFEEASGVTCFELYTPDLVNIFVTWDGVVSY